MSDMESNVAEVEWKMKHTEQGQLNCFGFFSCAPTPACRLQVGWFRQHAHCSSSPLFRHRKRADFKIDPVWEERKSISCKSWSLCLFRNLSGQKYPGYLQLQASPPPPPHPFFLVHPPFSFFFLSCHCPLASMFVSMWLPKRHWQLQIKMGGERVAPPLPPPTMQKGGGVECHKSPFDLSNQARSCCMQTFVIGIGGEGAAVAGSFCPCAPLSWAELSWAAAARVHLRMRG